MVALLPVLGPFTRVKVAVSVGSGTLSSMTRQRDVNGRLAGDDRHRVARQHRAVG